MSGRGDKPFTRGKIELKHVKLRPEVSEVEDRIVKWRRHFHMHPELSLEEKNTAAFIAKELKELGMEVTTGVGGHGVVGVLRGGNAKGKPKTVAIRADMDGLPIEEQNESEYCSQNKGVMHACGHDGHMAILLGAARVVAKWKPKLKGNIKFIFQPAEEGFKGAKMMIDDGVLTSEPKVDEIYGLHLWNYQEVGTVGARMGPVMAASDKFCVKVKGRGGHAAVPDGTADAVVASAQLITGFHTIVSRNVSPIDPAVVTVGTVNGGYAANVIADRVDISGTVRSFDSAVQDNIISRMQQICHGVGAAFDVKAQLQYTKGYPCTVNRSERHFLQLVKAATSIVGSERIVQPKQVMCAEDMSYFLDRVPGCFFFLGSAIDMDNIRPHHKSVFDIDERVLAIGASIWVELIDQLLV